MCLAPAYCYTFSCQDSLSGSSSRSIEAGPRRKRLRAMFDSVAGPTPDPGALSQPSSCLLVHPPAPDSLGLSSAVRLSRTLLRSPLLEWSRTGYSPSYRPPSDGLLRVCPIALAPLAPYRLLRVALSIRILSLPCRPPASACVCHQHSSRALCSACLHV